RILIIDDDPDVVESLTLVLEGNGHQVEVRYETTNLLAAVQEVHPDLIILDVIFPDDEQAGFKAARLLAGDAAVQDIPVLMLSAVNQLSNLGFSFSEKDISRDYLPVAGFIEKPVEPARLLEKIGELLVPTA
ncbi:MAG: response regulator, partial [Desulfobulbaceae bacterium]|nr:response regulator [Desulfobulbaceae bacterium]